MNLNASLFAQFVVFFILAIFTMKYVWPPLIKAIDERNKKIADGLAAADRAKAQMSAVEEQVENELKSVRKENQLRIHEAEKRAQLIIEEAKKSASLEAERIISAAKADAEQQVVQARDTLRMQVGSLVVKGAEQILQREINAASHTDLLKQLATEL